MEVRRFRQDSASLRRAAVWTLPRRHLPGQESWIPSALELQSNRESYDTRQNRQGEPASCGHNELTDETHDHEPTLSVGWQHGYFAWNTHSFQHSFVSELMIAGKLLLG
jgi:hypothetical protein